MDELTRPEPNSQFRGPEQLWNACAGSLRERLTDATWRTWFEGVRAASLSERRLVLTVPSSLVKERIAGRYLGELRGALAGVGAEALEVALEVSSDPGSDADRASAGVTTDDASASQIPTASTWPASSRTIRAQQRADTDVLNPRYTFEAFVIGDSNRFAHAAALSVAETPAKSYNPLFIYGGAGLGKTHLLHAIGHYVRQNYPDSHVRYVSTETFTNDFIEAIRTNANSAFKRGYRECDVLLVDDIQFLENKEGTQGEFFHTFNSLHGANAQIVISSDRPPRAIATLEGRLRSRFEWGLITDVTPPELETRLAILRKKAEGERAYIPDDVMEYIATEVTDNIRELEGALIRVSAYATLNHRALDRDLAERVLADIIGSEARQITPEVILNVTAKMFGFTIEELKGKSRRRPLVTARQISMYVFRELTDFSYPAIAREFGGRDHTTVIHAVDKISRLMKERRAIYDQVAELTQRIKTGG